MATEASPQRGYRATCPNCGAPVEFRSAASPVAVCGYCRSTLARDGDALKRIGQSAELFDDHSPLQLGAAGRHQGSVFTIVGRLQMRYADGAWNEWHALFDSGKSGWLSEDNGRYVLSFEAPAPAGVPPVPEALQPGQRLVLDGRLWEVASRVRARVAAAQGELPFAPNLVEAFDVADLRSAQDEVATLDWSEAPKVHWSIGRPIALADLTMSGLRDASEKTLAARALQCPSCGTALAPKLEATRSIVCHQCHAVVDLSKGAGGDLAHYAQAGGPEPQIPLGSVGQLALGSPTKPWQVVGFAERREIPSDTDEESVPWREYLLYHRTEGFAFLVDAEDGWSWTAPITGAPQGVGATVKWRGTTYRKLYDYTGETTWVLGEFYWKLERGQRTHNTDYAAGSKRLNREAAGGEITWSAGETLAADVVAKAFNLAPDRQAALQRDARPVSGGSARGIVWLIVALVVVVLLVAMCSRDECEDLRRTFGEASSEYQQCKRSGAGRTGFRTGGGSYGGFGSGGGHK